jgi:hypothetical protein
MFVFTTQNLKQLPLRTKIGLFFAIVFGITLLFLFGITFLVIALVGGLITMIANLFRGGRPRSRPLRDPLDNPFPPQRPPFQRSQPPRKMDDDDDIIDV